ncbi:MAG TPA: hypothetical protein VGY31_10065 [Terriglobia bacterium]|nr:hypothetical protein [Terriglobia bacterium]
MKKSFRGLLAGAAFLAGSLALPRFCAAQSPDTNKSPSASPAATSMAAPQDQGSAATLLKKQIEVQQKQIEQLQKSLTEQQHELEQLTAREKLQPPSAQPAAPNATATSVQAQPAQSIQSNKTNSKPLVATTGQPPLVASSLPGADSSDGLQAEPNPAIPNSPVPAEPLKIGNATLTPVGFVDVTAFFRSRNLGSGIGASFGSLPFSNTTAGQLSETRLTIQNSRFGLQYDSQFNNNKVRGYMETDFLGAQPTNAFVTSNSDSLRIRLYWVDITHGKFEFLGGQSWSLLTPGRSGISPMPSDIFYTQDMDTNYQVGLTWSRQLQFRFVYHASPAVTAALSLEDPEQFVGAGVTLPSLLSAMANEVDNNANTATPNVFPDVIGKLAFDPQVGGKHMHIEFAGLLSTFKTFNPLTNVKSTAEGGGGSFNFNLELFKNFHLVESSFYSSGGGRYIYGLAPDFVIRDDGSPSLVQADSGIGGFEYQATPKTMFYGYYGGAYIGRNIALALTSKGTYSPVGYGYTGSSSSDNRAIQEGTFGVIQTFWKNAHYGALQLITQYSYLTRAPWYVAPGSPKNANLSEAYADIRYVLP